MFSLFHIVIQSLHTLMQAQCSAPRSTSSRRPSRRPVRVFQSCCHAVDRNWRVIGGTLQTDTGKLNLKLFKATRVVNNLLNECSGFCGFDKRHFFFFLTPPLTDCSVSRQETLSNSQPCSVKSEKTRSESRGSWCQICLVFATSRFFCNMRRIVWAFSCRNLQPVIIHFFKQS